MSTKSTTRHQNLQGLLEEIEADDEFVEAFKDKVRKETLSALLQSMRASKGITQETMAERMNVSQSAVSKIEHKEDDAISLGELDAYMAAISEGLTIHLGKIPCKAERIKVHAFHIRRLLDELADEARDDDDIRQGVERFWMEVTTNIAALLGRSKAMPPDLIGKLFSEKDEDELIYRVLPHARAKGESGSVSVKA